MCSTSSTPGLFHHYSSTGHSHAWFVLVQITVCKTQSSHLEELIQEPQQEERGRYMRVERCGLATYMEVGAGGGGGENTFQLKENEA